MKSKRKVESKLLEYFFNFLNFDLNKLNYDNLISVSLAYVRFAYDKDADRLEGKHKLLSSPTYDQNDDKLNEVKIFLGGLQDHFKKILDIIYKPSVLRLKLKQRGERTISMKGDEFIQDFHIDEQPPKGLDLDAEIPYVESVFATTIINEDLLPKRFKKCRECQSFFYQNTNRPMIYCSTKCSNLYRQKKHIPGSLALGSGQSTIDKKDMNNLQKKKRQREKEVKKLQKKLPMWAIRQNQINAKILTLFLKLESQGLTEITEAQLAIEYGNPSEFNRNFTQMKIIAEKNHGKVFDVVEGVIKIWEPARELVDQYRKDVLG